jgi:hypothetical protein
MNLILKIILLIISIIVVYTSILLKNDLLVVKANETMDQKILIISKQAVKKEQHKNFISNLISQLKLLQQDEIDNKAYEDRLRNESQA